MRAEQTLEGVSERQILLTALNKRKLWRSIFLPPEETRQIKKVDTRFRCMYLCVYVQLKDSCPRLLAQMQQNLSSEK